MKTEWQPQDIKDFLSDFCSVTDEASIRVKTMEVYEEMLLKGYRHKEAVDFSDGYEKALMDIYKQI